MTTTSQDSTTAQAGGEAQERIVRQPIHKRLLMRPEMGAVIGLGVILLVFAVMVGDTGMFRLQGIVNFLQVSSQLGILAIFVSLLMIGGEFDLTLGSVIAFSGMALAIGSVTLGLPMWLVIILAFALALIIGFINGQIVIRTGLPSFIVTLGGLFLYRGLTIGLTRLITNRTQVGGVGDAAEGDWLAGFFSGTVGEPVFTWLAEIGLVAERFDGEPAVQGLPISIVWFVLLGALMTWVLLRTPFGNWIFASGGDPEAARGSGVPVNFVKVILFMGTALAATLVAVIQVLDAGSADTQRGLLRELHAIACAVIGGCLLTGGYGSAIGAMFGALIFGTTQMGIFYTGIDTDWFQVILGAMILLAVISNNFIRRKALGS